MTLTEDDAKQRWCPHVRVPAYEAQPTEEEGPASANRSPCEATQMHIARMHAATRCIGSGCMAWRWWNRLPSMHTNNSTGYCGLSGKPTG